MRSLLIGCLFSAWVGCKVDAIPLPGEDSGTAGARLDSGALGPSTGAPGCILDGGIGGGQVDGWLTDPTSPTDRPCACAEPDGPLLAIGQLATARALLPGRWLSCYRSSDAIGPWRPIGFVGIELVVDDSVTAAPSGGGRWYFLEAASDGTIRRGQGFDAQGTFLYNPLPGPDWEQIQLSASGKYDDFTVGFSDGPRKMRMLGPLSFTAVFVPLAP